jgi:hypothetical protein
MTRDGQSLTTSIQRSAQPMPSGHTPGSVTVTKQTKGSSAASPDATRPTTPRDRAPAPPYGQGAPAPPKSELGDAVSEISYSRTAGSGRRTPLLTITAQPEYADLSLEELRAQHYSQLAKPVLPKQPDAPVPSPPAPPSVTRSLPPLPTQDAGADQSIRAPARKEEGKAVGYVDVAVVAVKNVPSLAHMPPAFDILCAVIVDEMENMTSAAPWSPEVVFNEEFRFLAHSSTTKVLIDILARVPGAEAEGIGKCSVDVASLVRGGGEEVPQHLWYYVHGKEASSAATENDADVIGTPAGPCQIQLRLRFSQLASDVSKLANKKAMQGFKSPRGTPRSGSLDLPGDRDRDRDRDTGREGTMSEASAAPHRLNGLGGPGRDNGESRGREGAGMGHEEAAALVRQAVGLEVTIASARHLPKVDLLGSCDGYVGLEWRCQHQNFTTSVKKNTLSPDWGETFLFRFDKKAFESAQGSAAADLKLTVMDWNKLSHHAHIGDCVVEASRLRQLLVDNVDSPEQLPKQMTLHLVKPSTGLRQMNDPGNTVVGKDKLPTQACESETC